MLNQKDDSQDFNLRIPVSTILKILAAMAIVHAAGILGSFLMSLFLAVLVATSLTPLLDFLVRKGWSRFLGVAFITVIFCALIVFVILTIVPQLTQEFSHFMKEWPHFKTRLLNYFTDSNPLRTIVEQNLPDQTESGKVEVAPILNAGSVIFSGLTDVILIFVFSVYMLSQGPDIIEWLKAFFTADVKSKIDETLNEVSKIVSAYMLGQFVTSVLCFIYTYAALTYLKIPSALLLAVVAGIFDILPVLGFFLAIVPAIIFSIPVSGSAPLIVFGVYLVYHGIENYIIVPLVYGNRLRVSSFVVLLSLICAGYLAGIKGAIAVLPIVASYSIVERIWLKKYLQRGVVEAHK